MLQLDVQQRVFSISAATQGPILIISGVVMAPITARPASWPFRLRRQYSSSRLASRMACACGSSSSADARQVYPPAVRSNSGMPTSSSSALICAVTAGWLKCSSSAACVQVALLLHGDKGPQLINFRDDLSPQQAVMGVCLCPS